MWSDLERAMMQRALAEAKRGYPSPNPHVGAVIVHGGKIISVGHHERAGEAHAEVDAIRNAAASVEGATLFVTLEPCNHRGRTGPCTEAILDAGLARVVIGCLDPAPHVAGAVDRLRSAGVKVDVGLMERECSQLVADFTKHIRTGLPFVTLKAAVTLDGKIATRSGDSKWITGEEARTEAHRMRDQSDAILVGVGTVLSDDPKLTVRRVEGRDPIRVVLDADLRTPPGAAVLEPGQGSNAGVVVFHAADADPPPPKHFSAQGVELVPVSRNERGVNLQEVLQALGERGLVRLLVEGGAQVHGSFLDLGLADRAAIFVAPRIVGDASALSFAAGSGAASIEAAWRLVHTEFRALGPDWLISGDFERMQ
ncbi:MAG: bifunctional diaminohydroxyphosphoribosylaminopyrimidine deaminase/5-amino-6-(5-phosphoribosylamino)uracil reductase RibD [Myxococcales bacterium]|nr:bifunctional diaminohydroxyphosphoribosylaminopyrimidine deaminase/5-amino-6-(5-phosphoribosylamino)uracil reductase RibD [Myxococcales bacterium]